MFNHKGHREMFTKVTENYSVFSVKNSVISVVIK